MSPQQHVGIVQLGQCCMVNRHQAQRPQALDLATIVDDVAQAVERSASLQFLFGFADGARHAKAEP